jgi:hypothetical protein
MYGIALNSFKLKLSHKNIFVQILVAYLGCYSLAKHIPEPSSLLCDVRLVIAVKYHCHILKSILTSLQGYEI